MTKSASNTPQIPDELAVLREAIGRVLDEIVRDDGYEAVARELSERGSDLDLVCEFVA